MPQISIGKAFMNSASSITAAADNIQGPANLAPFGQPPATQHCFQTTGIKSGLAHVSMFLSPPFPDAHRQAVCLTPTRELILIMSWSMLTFHSCHVNKSFYEKES